MDWINDREDQLPGDLADLAGLYLQIGNLCLVIGIHALQDAGASL